MIKIDSTFWMRVYLFVAALVTLINFAVFNDPGVWWIVNITFVLTPFFYVLAFGKQFDRVAFAVIVVLALATVYQYLAGKALITTSDVVWQVIDTIAVLFYAYLAGTPKARICD